MEESQLTEVDAARDIANVHANVGYAIGETAGYVQHLFQMLRTWYGTAAVRMAVPHREMVPVSVEEVELGLFVWILALRGDEQKTRFSIETEELIVLQISFSLVFKIFFGYDSGHYALIGILLVVFRVIIAPRAFQLGCGGIDIELGLILADDDAAAVIARFSNEALRQ